MRDVPRPRSEELRELVRKIGHHLGHVAPVYDLQDLAADLQALGTSKARSRLVRDLARHDPPSHLVIRSNRVLAYIRLRQVRPSLDPDRDRPDPYATLLRDPPGT